MNRNSGMKMFDDEKLFSSGTGSMGVRPKKILIQRNQQQAVSKSWNMNASARTRTAWTLSQQRHADPADPDGRKNWVDAFMTKIEDNQAAQSLLFSGLSK